MSETLKDFSDQTTTNQFLDAFFYIFATMGVLLGTASIVLIDAAVVREKNHVTTITQKLLSACIGSVVFMVIGYAIWNLQYYEAFATPNALYEAIATWSICGLALNHYS